MPGVWAPFGFVPIVLEHGIEWFHFVISVNREVLNHVILSAQVSIRVCDVNQGKLGEKAIALVLPTLLHKGVGSKAEEVRAIRYELENFHLST